MTDTTAPPHLSAEDTAERLRNGAAWLKLAAEDLERGDAQAAGQMAHLGRVCVEDAEQHVAHLAEETTR